MSNEALMVKESTKNSREIHHLYGDNYHILDDNYLRSRLAYLSQAKCKQPEINLIITDLYSQMVRHVINNEIPTKEVEIETRMAELSPDGIWKGEVIDSETKLVTVNIARAGSLPSQVCFDTCNLVLNPDLVRQDHMYMARKTDTEGKVVGVDFSGNKVGGAIEDSVVIFPDPMGATGGSMIEAVNYYKNSNLGTARKYISLHLIVTSEYIRRMKQEAPDLIVYALRIDRGASSEKVKNSIPGEFIEEEKGLTDIQYIVPGAGGLGELINNSYC